jgi:hypothetical protein
MSTPAWTSSGLALALAACFAAFLPLADDFALMRTAAEKERKAGAWSERSIEYRATHATYTAQN